MAICEACGALKSLIKCHNTKTNFMFIWTFLQRRPKPHGHHLSDEQWSKSTVSTEIQKVRNTVWLMPVDPWGFSLYARAFNLILNRFGFQALCLLFKCFLQCGSAREQLRVNGRLSIDNTCEITVDIKPVYNWSTGSIKWHHYELHWSGTTEAIYVFF